jgi:hypothetical protein
MDILEEEMLALLIDEEPLGVTLELQDLCAHGRPSIESRAGIAATPTLLYLRQLICSHRHFCGASSRCNQSNFVVRGPNL